MPRYQTGYDDALAGRPEAPKPGQGRYGAGYEQGKLALRRAAYDRAVAVAPKGDGPSVRLGRELARHAAQVDMDQRLPGLLSGRREPDQAD
jgi:hypothetical protein